MPSAANRSASPLQKAHDVFSSQFKTLPKAEARSATAETPLPERTAPPTGQKTTKCVARCPGGIGLNAQKLTNRFNHPCFRVASFQGPPFNRAMKSRLLSLVLLAARIHISSGQVTPPVFNGVSGKAVPPPGIEIPETDRRELADEVASLGREIESLRTSLAGRPLLELLPDVEVFREAVRYPLVYNEFYKTGEVATARALLREGRDRARALRAGRAPWTTATGNVVRGYRSRVDGSVQPYGVVVPPDWREEDRKPRPLWLWLHGRSETLTELAFVSGQMRAKPEFETCGGFLVRLYGRFCNASKFAGETDLFEAMASAKARYPVDEQRIVLTGFSMGGASCWHLSTHYAGLWAAASPGAGFAETAIYAKVFAPGREAPPWWEQKLWHWYDATDDAANLFNTRLIAYSGGDDPQKQSADIMETAAAAEGLRLERLIGPNTGHKYEPATKKELDRRLLEQAVRGKPARPAKVRFTTYTLRYHRMDWLEIEALDKHWSRADLDAELADGGMLQAKTRNVAGFSVLLPDDLPRRAIIDGQEVLDPAGTGHYMKTAGKWAAGASGGAGSLVKRHGLTGPVDDAFLDSFIFVRPTGRAFHDQTGAWVRSELDRAIAEWRRVFRGEARVKNDVDVTSEDIAGSNLVLWGDPSSNSLLGRALPKLPIRWRAEELSLGSGRWSAADHVPILILGLCS